MNETAQIVDVAFGGKGVARVGGKAVFIPFTIPDEKVTARIVRQRKKFAEAELVSVEKSSPDRVQPQCRYFGRCGGCAYQHIAYARQLALKSNQVEQLLRRVGRLENVPMRPTIASPQQYNYRNRIRVHAKNGVVGFYSWDNSELVDIEFCPISNGAVNEKLRALRREKLGDGSYTLAAKSEGAFFTQVNEGAAAELLSLVEQLVARDHKWLIDAYCGAGFFAKHLREFFDEIIGIEEDERAVAHAQKNAAQREKYICDDIEMHLNAVLSETDPGRTTLLLDPPAAGISARVSDIIIAAKPAEVIYVSCDPATLARDLAILCRTYSLNSVTPLDMFPQTAQIEVVARLHHTRQEDKAPAQP